MSDPIRNRLHESSLALVLALAAGSFLLGIRWGLPSHASDRFLFGTEPVWSGEKIAALAPPESDERGADVDANPLGDRKRVVVLNDTDAQRAEILRRYRLFSYQPDEMITFSSLSRIRQNRGDPRLYQYGGLWIYPVGALLKIASLMGYVDLRSDQAYYLDHPEAFGRFYVVARLYSAFWGLVATWAVFWIVRRMTGGILLATAAALCFALMPVVVNMAHEAKPHLPGAALVLLTAICSAKFVETGRTKWALWSGIFCGAAAGMILVGFVAFSVLAVMAALPDNLPLGKRRGRAATLGPIGIALGVYVVTNPFVLINAVAHPQRLRSNLHNTTEMYPPSVRGFGNAIFLVAEGASPVVTAVGVAGGVFLLAGAAGREGRRFGRMDDEDCPGRGDVGWLLAAPAALIAVPYVLLAANKPPEYARFALLVDIALLVAAFAMLARLRNRSAQIALGALLFLTTAAAGFPYLLGFVRDCRPITSRLAAAEHLKRLADMADSGGDRGGASTVRVPAEPAPYVFPPVDLFRYRLLLPPTPQTGVGADVMVALEQRRSPHPISWADQRFVIRSPMDQLREIGRAALRAKPGAEPPVGPANATRPIATTTLSSPP